MKEELQHIIKACIKQDRKAQRELYQQYARWGLTICRRYVISEERAQEACNDAFLRIFKKIDSYDPNKGQFKSWMARVFINCALTTTKKEAFNNSFSSLADLAIEPVSTQTFNNYNGEDLLKFLKKMPIGYRTVFNLYVMDGYSHKEIGAKLDISEITSRSQLRKAKIWIKENVSLDTLKTYGH